MILKVVCAPTFGSYYYEDVASLQGISVPESERWFKSSETPGFTKMREVAETISIGLSDGSRIAWGDCVGVSYAGKSGRKSLFRHEEGRRAIETIVAPWLRNQNIDSLRQFGLEWDSFRSAHQETLHPAIGYGLSQAILNYLAPAGDQFKVIAREWGLTTENLEPIALQGSCGNNRYENADKMIVRRIAAFPQSQVDDIKNQLGERGEVLRDYAKWLVARLAEFKLANYDPCITLDVHGALGTIFQNNVTKVGDYLREIEELLSPYKFRIESPMLVESVESQIAIYSSLRNYLVKTGSKVQLAADEWANTKQDIQKFADSRCVDLIHIKTPDLGSVVDVVDAVLYCKAQGMGVLLGGSCVETDISTRATVHVAMATRPDFLLVKPGMGFDEGFMLCQGEMARIRCM